MNYKLKFDKSGKFDGWQEVEWMLKGDRFRIIENQFYQAGQFVQSTLSVYDREDCSSYNFRDGNWGSPEMARDAAEEFALGWKNVELIEEGSYMYRVEPNTEEVYCGG